MSLRILSFLFCCLAFQFANAAVKVSVNSDTVSAIQIDSADATNITLFAGFSGLIGDCTTPNNTAVCNSCPALNLTSVYQCTERSIYPSLNLTMTVSLDTIPTTPKLSVQWTDTATTEITNLTSPPTSFAANQAFTVQIPWSEICTKAGLTATCDYGNASTHGGTGTLTVGLTDGSTTYATGNSQKFTVRMVYAQPSDNSEIIAAPTQSPSTSQGFTDVKVSPGDGKVYVSDIFRGSTTPPNSTSGIKYNALRVYYAPYTGSPNFTEITYGGNFQDLLIEDKTNVTTTLSDNKVTGLINDQDYMFNIASVDEATVVSGFINPAGLNGLADADKARYLAQPGEVVGLLDNKKCFIATAAFGSQMAPQVELLRQFRNQFLVPTEWGRKFVHLYYKYSPPAAQFISEHDGLRAVIRGALWPVIFFADLSLKYGFFLTFGLFALTLLSLILMVRHLRRAV